MLELESFSYQSGKQARERSEDRMLRNKNISLQVKIEIERRGLSRAEAARDFLDISSSYLSALLTLKRLWDELPIERLRLVSKFLGVTLLSIQYQLGVLLVGDSMVNNDAGSLNIIRASSLEKMRRDPVISSYVPSNESFESLPEEIKNLLVFLYEHFWMLRAKNMLKEIPEN